MKTISVYLETSGSVARLEKDFNLYQGSYQNTMLDIYVPVVLLGTSTAVKVASKSISRAGKVVLSRPYYLPLLYRNEEYAVYEALLPSPFTANVGSGENATTLIANVVNINEGETESIITTQEVKLDVLAGSRLEGDEPVETSELEALNARLNDKVDKIPVGEDGRFLLETDSIEVIGAINELNRILTIDYNPNDEEQISLIDQVIANVAKLMEHTTKLGTLNTAVDTNTNAIADINKALISGLDRIGLIKQADKPTDEQLTQFVFDQTSPSREPRNGDYVQWVDTDNGKKYNIFFTKATGWQEPDEQEGLEVASNTSMGVVRGNVNDDTSNTIKVSIVQGIIKDIKVLLSNGEYQSLHDYLVVINNKINGLVDGSIKVGYALKAGEAVKANSAVSAERAIYAGDEETPIVSTYAKKDDVYTKDESDKTFLPIDYNYVYYFSKEGIVDIVPTDVTPQFEVNISTIGDTQLFDIDRTLKNRYTFNKNTRDVSQVWISTDRLCNLRFRLTTYGIKGAENIVLGVDTTGLITFRPNEPRAVNITCIYNQLVDEVELAVGNKIRKKLEIITDFSTATNVKMWCNETYPSTFNLVAKALTFNVNEITGKKAYEIKVADWIPNADGTYTATITQRQHKLAPTNQYGIDVMYATSSGWQRVVVSPIITDDGTIILNSAKALDCTMLIWVAVDIDHIGENGSRLYINGAFMAELSVLEDIGNHQEGVSFDIEPKVVAEMFDISAPTIAIGWSNYILDLHRFDREESGDKVYFSNVLIYKKIRYTYTLEVDKTTNKGIFTKTEEDVIPAPTTADSGKVLGVNAQGDYEYVDNADVNKISSTASKYKFNQLLNTENSLLPSANGLIVTNIYGGHHITGTTDRQYYHKMYVLDTIQGHWYYFAPNFSDTKSVYILGHIDSTTFSTNKGKVFEGGSKFDAYIQIEKDKTMDFDVKPILVDLTEMFGAGNEPTTEEDVYVYFDKNTYYPYTDTANMSVVEKKLSSYDVTDVITFTEGATFTIAEGALDSKYVAQINIKGADNEIRTFSRVSTNNSGTLTFSQMYSTDDGASGNFIVIDTNSNQGIYHEKPMGGGGGGGLTVLKNLYLGNASYDGPPYSYREYELSLTAEEKELIYKECNMIISTIDSGIGINPDINIDRDVRVYPKTYTSENGSLMAFRMSATDIKLLAFGGTSPISFKISTILFCKI